jgi:hypothetical protein
MNRKYSKCLRLKNEILHVMPSPAPKDGRAGKVKIMPDCVFGRILKLKRDTNKKVLNIFFAYLRSFNNCSAKKNQTIMRKTTTFATISVLIPPFYGNSKELIKGINFLIFF